jgi:hypothetical protein
MCGSSSLSEDDPLSSPAALDAGGSAELNSNEGLGPKVSLVDGPMSGGRDPDDCGGAEARKSRRFTLNVWSRQVEYLEKIFPAGPQVEQ